VKFWVAITHNKWFRFLAQQQPDEVNFWQPGRRRVAFRVVPTGAPFLFKLHSPLNYIVGGGFLVRHSFLPLSIAWDAFGAKNGAPELARLRSMILRLRAGEAHPDPTIGCIVLAEPFFLPENLWIPIPSDWSPNIVQGKTFDTAEPTGKVLWDRVRLAMGAVMAAAQVPQRTAVSEEAPRYGAAYLAEPPLGQGGFRVEVTEAYQRRCAVTGERTLHVLQAAHIKPYAESGPNAVANGLLLRADLHILLDRGYLTLNDDLRVEVSRRIKEECDNGEQYNALHGQPLCVVPRRAFSQPASEYIRWYQEHRFLS